MAKKMKEAHTVSTKLSGFGFKDNGSFWSENKQQNSLELTGVCLHYHNCTSFKIWTGTYVQSLTKLLLLL